MTNPGTVDDDRLLAIAMAIADGTPVDWGGVSSTPESSIYQFQQLERLVRGHEELRSPGDAPDENATRDTILTEARRGASAVAESMPLHWGPLTIIEKVGRGTFGDVYRARDPKLDRPVALKLLRRREEGGAALESAVIEEGRLLARVRHPNVVTVYGAERIDGRVGLWMEFVGAGRTLEDELRARGPFPADEVAAIGRDLAAALGAVHRAGLRHRDVKAQNAIRDADGRIVLTDLGAGHLVDNGEGGPADHGLAGTPLYLAPEVLQGAPASVASDLYSLGVVLFHLATASFPVRGRSLGEIREAHRQGRCMPTRTLRPDLPKSLLMTIERALATDPAKRFETAAAMESALTLEWPDAARPTAVARARMRRAAIAMAIVAIAIVVTVWRSAPSVRPSAPGSSMPSTEGSVTLQRVSVELERRVNIHALGNDGHSATCTPLGRMAVAICDLTTGSVRVLRLPRSSIERSPGARLSPDGTQVAYMWTDDSARSLSLRVINIDGTGDREVYPRQPWETLFLLKWIQDGRALLSSTSLGSGNGARYVALPIDGGGAEEVWRFEQSPVGIDLSPDERFLVFARAASGQNTSDLGIVDLSTGEQSWLLTHPADDSSPMWTPDGRAIVFLSDRLGGSGLFVLPVREGRPDGDPTLIRDLGRSTVVPLGFARDGSLLLRMITHWVDAYRSTVDLEAGVIGLPARLDTRSIEETASPDWSADGRRLAYISGPIGRLPDAKAHVVIRRADGSLERELPAEVGMGRGARLRWSPDGRHLAVRYDADSSEGAVYLVDAGTGASRLLLRGLTGPFTWSGDGSAVYYSDGNQIRSHDIAAGTTSAIFSTRGLGPFDVSRRDGSLALSDHAGPRCAVRILSAGGRLVDRHRFDGQCWAVAWSRDGSKLLVSVLTAPEEPAHLWVMDAASGEPVRVIVPTDAINALSLGPGDRDLVFSAGNPRPDFWILRGAGIRPSTNPLSPGEPVTSQRNGITAPRPASASASSR